jgi:lysozyme
MLSRSRAAALAVLAVSTLLAPVGCVADPGTGTTLGDDGTRETESVRCAAGSTVEGIDVSYWDGTIDWNKVKASGKVFAIARIGDGTFVDPTFDKNWAAIQAAGLIRGAYQFFRPADDATKLADIVVAKVGKLGADDLPVTIDVEAADGVAPATVAARIQTWIDRVTAGTGKAPIVYTGKYFWNDNVKSTAQRNNALWIAQYGPVCPDLPSPWTDWKFFQYSEKGSVPGISTAVDLDRYNGTRDALLAFARGTPTTGGASGGGGTPTPTPSPAASGCWSNTLGKEVPLNTCVQSKSDRLWYQCSGDNKWVDRKSDPAACVSVNPLP